MGYNEKANNFIDQFSRYIITNKMGCGSFCGDTNTIDTLINMQTKIAHEKIFQEIKQHRQFANTQPYLSFMQKYRLNPSQFYLNIKRKPIKDEELNICLMTKWRIFIIGLNYNNNQDYQCIATQTNCIEQNSKLQQELNQSVNLIYHKQFVQIEKDIERTFGVFGEIEGYQIKFKQFENILKRITNHFPKMGYSQGINFVISYLLIIGYSQKDCFDVFINLATGKRYLLLGMYQNGFPLFSSFNLLFQNIIKRTNPTLYNHLIITLSANPFAWIYKWFTTFFIINFPKEVVKHLWDFVIIIGSIGMVFIAISLLEQLQQFIMEVGQCQDFYALVYSLKEIDSFNQHINIQRLITSAYNKEILEEDFKNVENVGGFYGLCLKFNHNQRYKHQRKDLLKSDQSQLHKTQQLWLNWRRQLQKDRIKFKQDYQKSIQMTHQQTKLPISTQPLQNQNEDIQVVIFNVEKPQILTQTLQIKLTDRNRNRSAKSQTKMYTRQKVEYLFNEINQKVSQEDQEAISQPSVKDKNEKNVNQFIDMDQLDKLQLQVRQKKNKPLQIPTNYMASNFSHMQKRSRQNRQNKNQPNLFTLAGNISLKNDISYDAVSISSNQNSNKEKSVTSKQVLGVKSNRICGCKIKTEQNKCQSVDQKSQMGQSKYQFSDKDSLSINHYSQNSQIHQANSVSNVNSHRERISTHSNFMVNSHLPPMTDSKKKISILQNPKIESDVQILTLQQPFKKNRRARVNIVTPSSQSPRRQAIIVRTIGFEPQQQSLQQINQIDRFSRAQSHYSKGNEYQIESIK